MKRKSTSWWRSYIWSDQDYRQSKPRPEGCGSPENIEPCPLGYGLAGEYNSINKKKIDKKVIIMTIISQ